MSAPPIGRISRKPTASDSTISSMKVIGWPWNANHTSSARMATPISALSGCWPLKISGARSEEHTSELQSHRDLHSFPTRRSSDLEGDRMAVEREPHQQRQDGDADQRVERMLALEDQRRAGDQALQLGEGHDRT